jgi:hypothetical protein
VDRAGSESCSVAGFVLPYLDSLATAVTGLLAGHRHLVLTAQGALLLQPAPMSRMFFYTSAPHTSSWIYA